MGACVEWELFCSPQKGCSASSYSWHLAMHAKQNFVFFTLYIRLMQFFLFFFIFFDKLSDIYFGFQLFLRSKTFFTRRMSDKRPPFRSPYLDLHTLRKGDLKSKMEHWSKNLFWFNCYLPLCIAFDSRKAKILPTLLQHLNHAACLSEIFFSLFRNETAKQWENSVKIFTILGSIWGPNKNKKHFLWAALALTWP